MGPEKGVLVKPTGNVKAKGNGRGKSLGGEGHTQVCTKLSPFPEEPGSATLSSTER